MIVKSAEIHKSLVPFVAKKEPFVVRKHPLGRTRFNNR